MQETPPTPPSSIVLAPVVTQNVTELIADQIRQRIFSGEFQPGEVLPTEVELMQQTTMSRSSVRSALRILQTQGLIQLRPGRLGGAVVMRPGEDELEATINQLIRGRRLGLPDLLEMQKAVEPQCAALAAAKHTDDDVVSLTAALGRITGHDGDMTSLLEAHADWHIAVARASHNELLAGLMAALVHWIHTATEASNVLAGPVATSAYEDITEAIITGDADLARDRMETHVFARARTMSAQLAST